MVENEILTVTEFLEARITEDEAAARACESFEWRIIKEEEDTRHPLWVEGLGISAADSNWDACIAVADAQHATRHDPASVLAECAAKRAIIAFDQDKQIWDPRGFSADTTSEAFISGGPKDPQARHVTRILAAVYKDHPDYQQKWAL